MRVNAVSCERGSTTVTNVRDDVFMLGSFFFLGSHVTPLQDALLLADCLRCIWQAIVRYITS